MSKGTMTAGSEAVVAEVSEGRGERAVASGAPVLAAVPDPEVPAKPRRRRFTAEYKLRILREVEPRDDPRKPESPRNHKRKYRGGKSCATR